MATGCPPNWLFDVDPVKNLKVVNLPTYKSLIKKANEILMVPIYN